MAAQYPSGNTRLVRPKSRKRATIEETDAANKLLHRELSSEAALGRKVLEELGRIAQADADGTGGADQRAVGIDGAGVAHDLLKRHIDHLAIPP